MKELNNPDILFTDLIRQWLNYVKPRLDKTTYEGYIDNANAQIFPYFDPMQLKLCDVRRGILQDYIDYLAENGRKDGTGGLKGSAIRRHRVIINQALEWAIELDIIVGNQLSHVHLPKLTKAEIKYYNAEELNNMFTAIKSEPLFPLISIAFILGLRRSEVLGLKWCNIDFRHDNIAICHTVTCRRELVTKDTTKSKSSNRLLPLDDDIKALLYQLKREEEHNQAIEPYYQVNDYVFKNIKGVLLNPDFVSKSFSKILKKYNLPHISFHGLRHSCATLMKSNGEEIVNISNYLGHSSTAITAAYYLHTDMTSKVKSLNILRSVIH
jgi:integrase